MVVGAVAKREKGGELFVKTGCSPSKSKSPEVIRSAEDRPVQRS